MAPPPWPGGLAAAAPIRVSAAARVLDRRSLVPLS